MLSYFPELGKFTNSNPTICPMVTVRNPIPYRHL